MWGDLSILSKFQKDVAKCLKLCYTYGKLIARTGETNAIFLYNGRDGVVTEPNGLIYMRARYYSPKMKRFINADIVAGEIINAITLNRYAYANANPVSFVDPFGLSGERTDEGEINIDDEIKKMFMLVGTRHGLSMPIAETFKMIVKNYGFKTTDKIEVKITGNFKVTYEVEQILGNGDKVFDVNKVDEMLGSEDIEEFLKESKVFKKAIFSKEYESEINEYVKSSISYDYSLDIFPLPATLTLNAETKLTLTDEDNASISIIVGVEFTELLNNDNNINYDAGKAVVTGGLFTFATYKILPKLTDSIQPVSVPQGVSGGGGAPIGLCARMFGMDNAEFWSCLY